MTIIVQTSVATDEVKELFLQKYYVETVRLIFDDSEAIHNVDGTKDGEIADRVFYILYKVDDNLYARIDVTADNAETTNVDEFAWDFAD